MGARAKRYLSFSSRIEDGQIPRRIRVLPNCPGHWPTSQGFAKDCCSRHNFSKLRAAFASPKYVVALLSPSPGAQYRGATSPICS